jgi:hypothetical protein
VEEKSLGDLSKPLAKNFHAQPRKSISAPLARWKMAVGQRVGDVSAACRLAI